MKTTRRVGSRAKPCSRHFAAFAAALLFWGGSAASADAAGPALDIVIEEGSSAELEAKP